MRAIIPLTVTLLFMAWGSAPAQAGDLPAPEADIVLSVSGMLEHTNTEDGTATFDMDMLRALPSETIETTTIWTEGTQVFEGVALKTLLDQLGAEGSVILASAINDYTIEIPVESLTDTTPVVAYSLNGEEMSRRQKGPLWIVYPYDSDPEFQTEVIYSRSIWQLDRLKIEQ